MVISWIGAAPSKRFRQGTGTQIKLAEDGDRIADIDLAIVIGIGRFSAVQ